MQKSAYSCFYTWQSQSITGSDGISTASTQHFGIHKHTHQHTNIHPNTHTHSHGNAPASSLSTQSLSLSLRFVWPALPDRDSLSWQARCLSPISCYLLCPLTLGSNHPVNNYITPVGFSPQTKAESRWRCLGTAPKAHLLMHVPIFKTRAGKLHQKPLPQHKKCMSDTVCSSCIFSNNKIK